MKDPLWEVCMGCMSEGCMVYDREGDYVCKRCGLVKAGSCIDDTVDFFMSEQCAPLVDYKKRDWELEACLFGLDEELVDECFRMYEEAKEKGLGGRKKAELMGACVYMASSKMKRGIAIGEVLKRVAIDKERDLWSIVREIGNKGNAVDVADAQDKGCEIARMVHSLDLGRAWDVIKVAKGIAKKVRERRLCQGMKASKINACIIYMACMACGDTGGMGMKEMAERLGVGLSTMKKHEKMLREALV